MYFIVTLLISIIAWSAEAPSRIAVIKLHGEQRVWKGYGVTSISPEAEIIWDSQKDGPLPPMADYEVVSKSGKNLIVDPVKVQAKNDKIALEQLKKNQEGAMKEELATLKAKLEVDTITAAEVRRLLKLYLKIKGD